MGPKLVFGKALGEIGFGLVNAQLPKNEPASERARQFSMTVENSTLVGGGWVRFVGGKVREVRDFGVRVLWATWQASALRFLDRYRSRFRRAQGASARRYQEMSGLRSRRCRASCSRCLCEWQFRRDLAEVCKERHR
jgi:hypothetical protein